MKRVLQVLLGLVLLLVLVVGGYAAYISATWDKDHSATPKPAIKASTDPEVIKRGEYVVHSVAHCSVCHAPAEVTAKREPGDHPPMPGGFEWKLGPLGTLYSRNITSDRETGIGAWSDEELARAIKWSVGRDGKLLTFMALAAPAMADEDLVAVVSYLRTTAPVKQQNKANEAGLILKWMSSKLGPDFRKSFVEGLKYEAAPAEPSIARGQYLARGPGWCIGCHSPFDIATMTLSGAEFSGSADPEPDKDDESYVFRVPNLTSDPQTGLLHSWDEEHFVERFQAGRAIKNSKMPWEAFREMTDVDLRSVFRYLKTLPPAKHYIGPSFRKASEDPSKDAAAVKT